MLGYSCTGRCDLVRKEDACMRVCVRGIRTLDFKTAEGEIKGTQIFYSHPNDGVVGEKTDKLFVRSGFPLPSDLTPGKFIDVFCDTKGRLEHIQLVAAK